MLEIGGATITVVVPRNNRRSCIGERLARTCGSVGLSGVSGKVLFNAAKLSMGTGINAITGMLA